MPIVTQNARPEPDPALLPPPPVSDQYTPDVADAPVTVQDRSRSAIPFGPTPLASAFRYVQPTWRNYISYVDMEARAGNADAQRYVRIWQSLPYKERVSHVPEQLCELASVTAADLIGWVSRNVWVEGSAATSMVLSFNRDQVLARTAEFALASPDNARHAELFLKASGALPASNGGGRGGQPINIFNAPVASSGSVALAGAKSDSCPVSRSGLRGMDEEIVELSRIMQREDLDQTLHATAEDVPDEPDNDNDDDEPEGDDDE